MILKKTFLRKSFVGVVTFFFFLFFAFWQNFVVIKTLSRMPIYLPFKKINPLYIDSQQEVLSHCNRFRFGWKPILVDVALMTSCAY